MVLTQVHLQLAITRGHDCESSGYFLKFIGHDALIVNLYDRQVTSFYIKHCQYVLFCVLEQFFVLIVCDKTNKSVTGDKV